MRSRLDEAAPCISEVLWEWGEKVDGIEGGIVEDRIVEDRIIEDGIIKDNIEETIKANIEGRNSLEDLTAKA